MTVENFEKAIILHEKIDHLERSIKAIKSADLTKSVVIQCYYSRREYDGTMILIPEEYREEIIQRVKNTMLEQLENLKKEFEKL